MNAETQAVIDAAWDVTNFREHLELTPLTDNEKALKSALQVHAKAHPPEPTTKGAKPEEAQGVYTFKVGDTVKIFCTLMGPDVGIVQKIQSPEDGGRVTVSYTVPGVSRPLTCSYDAGDLTLLAPGNKPYAPDETTTGPMPPKKAERAGITWPDYLRGECLILPGETPSAQPTILRPQEGDVCVLGFNRKISQENRDLMVKHWEEQVPGIKVVLVDDCSGVQSFRPAKGGDDDAK